MTHFLCLKRDKNHFVDRLEDSVYDKEGKEDKRKRERQGQGSAV